MSKNTTCCFTGHRPHKFTFGYDEESEECILLKSKLFQQILEMRKKGVTTFLTGMAMGVDIWAAELILGLKAERPEENICLIAVIPHEGQANRWSAEYRERYFNILSKVDDDVMIGLRYTKSCMFERNRYMVDHSAHLIAVYNGEPGGTQYTVDYAMKKGLDVVIINPDDMAITKKPRFRGLTLLK